MMGLPDRERSLTISSAVWIECTNVTGRQTDRQPDGWMDGWIPGHSKDRAYAQRGAVKTQLSLTNRAMCDGVA